MQTPSSTSASAPTMPYIPFHTTNGGKVELSGNNLEQITAAIEKNGQIANPQIALAMVKAYFHRRDLQVKKQKCIQAEDEAGADAADAELEPAEEEEEKMKKAYHAACTSGSSSSSSSSSAPVEKKEEDPYAYLKPAAASSSNAAAPADDDFM